MKNVTSIIIIKVNVALQKTIFIKISSLGTYHNQFKQFETKFFFFYEIIWNIES